MKNSNLKAENLLERKARRKEAALAYEELLVAQIEERIDKPIFHEEEERVLVRALDLADIVSDMIWGGERGWEGCTDAQFRHLTKTLRERLKLAQDVKIVEQELVTKIKRRFGI